MSLLDLFKGDKKTVKRPNGRKTNNRKGKKKKNIAEGEKCEFC